MPLHMGALMCVCVCVLSFGRVGWFLIALFWEEFLLLPSSPNTCFSSSGMFCPPPHCVSTMSRGTYAVHARPTLLFTSLRTTPIHAMSMGQSSIGIGILTPNSNARSHTAFLGLPAPSSQRPRQRQRPQHRRQRAERPRRRRPVPPHSRHPRHRLPAGPRPRLELRWSRVRPHR